MIFVKNSRGGREVNMINNLSKINLSKLGWEGGGSTSIGIMSLNILFFLTAPLTHELKGIQEKRMYYYVAEAINSQCTRYNNNWHRCKKVKVPGNSMVKQQMFCQTTFVTNSFFTFLQGYGCKQRVNIEFIENSYVTGT